MKALGSHGKWDKHNTEIYLTFSVSPDFLTLTYEPIRQILKQISLRNPKSNFGQQTTGKSLLPVLYGLIIFHAFEPHKIYIAKSSKICRIKSWFRNIETPITSFNNPYKKTGSITCKEKQPCRVFCLAHFET